MLIRFSFVLVTPLETEKLIRARIVLNNHFQSSVMTVEQAWEKVIEHLEWSSRTTVEQIMKKWKNMVHAWKKDRYGVGGERQVQRRIGTSWFSAMDEFNLTNPQINPRRVHDSTEDLPRENLDLTQRDDDEDEEEHDEDNTNANNVLIRSRKKSDRVRPRRNLLAERVMISRQKRPARKSNYTLLSDGLKIFEQYVKKDEEYKNKILQILNNYMHIQAAIAGIHGAKVSFGSDQHQEENAKEGDDTNSKGDGISEHGSSGNEWTEEDGDNNGSISPPSEDNRSILNDQNDEEIESSDDDEERLTLPRRSHFQELTEVFSSIGNKRLKVNELFTR